MYGHRVVGDTERPVGEVTAFPEDKAKNSPCVEDTKVGERAAIYYYHITDLVSI